MVKVSPRFRVRNGRIGSRGQTGSDGPQPKTLNQEQRKHHRGDALWQVEMESADAGESVGHQADEQTYSV